MRFSTLFMSFFFCLNIFSQELALGNVTVEELQKTQSDIEPDAPAEYIFKKGRYSLVFDPNYGIVTVVEIKVKIKIYSKEGYDWANETFDLSANEVKKYSISDAITYNLVEGKIEKSKLKKDGIFEEKSNDYYNSYQIKMPNVKVGSIIEFCFKYETTQNRSLPQWFFQFQIPIQNCELTVRSFKDYDYDLDFKPFLKIDKSQETISSLGGEMFLITKYEVKNVKAVKDEPYVVNLENFISSIRFYLPLNYLNYGSETIYINPWEDIARFMYEDENFGKQLEVKDYFENDLNAFIRENEAKYNKTEAVFNFVQERMTWNRYNGIKTDLGLKEAYKEKTGNTADINLMLVSFFKSQGIKANPIILSTRSNGVTNLPNIFAYNYVVAGVETDEGVVLFDATSKYTTKNMLAFRALNWFGRMLLKTRQSEEISLMPQKLSNENLNSSIEINNDGSISGKYRKQMTDYFSLNYRENYGLLTKEINIERIEKGYNNFDIQELNLKNINDINQPIIEEVSFTMPNAVDFIGDKIYFNPTFMFGLKSNPFLSDSRDFPIDFDFPKEYKNLIVIKIPQGYEVESLPISTILEFEDDMLGYKYQVQQINNTIQILTVFNINHSLISESKYTLIKDFFSKIVEKDNEPVVLKKM